MKLIRIINIVLLMAAVLLIINLIHPISSISGSLTYNLDPSDPECYFINSGNLNEVPIDSCCYEIQKQLHCQPDDTNIKCYTSETSGKYYSLNQKAFNYCRKDGYDIEIK